jgi:hypothetical protein
MELIGWGIDSTIEAVASLVIIRRFTGPCIHSDDAERPPARSSPSASSTNAELDKIAAADDLEHRPAGADGRLRKPLTIWIVRQGDDIYVRSCASERRAQGWTAKKHRSRVHGSKTARARRCAGSVRL